MLCFHISGPYTLAFLTRVSQPGSTLGCCPHHATGGAQHDWPSTLWLTITACGYLCIYNFPMPMRPSCQPTWPASSCQPTWAAFTHALLSSCLHSWNVLFQQSLIDGSVKGQYATYSQKFLKSGNYFNEENVRVMLLVIWYS